MKVNLFDIDPLTGAAKITRHVKDNWFLQEIVNKFGTEDALKLFKVFDKVCDMNPETCQWANNPEDTKYEEILRTLYPDLSVKVEMDDIIVEQALESVRTNSETSKSRKYKALKIAYEKVLKEVEFEQVSLRKEDGNTAEYAKAVAFLKTAEKDMSDAFKEYEEEIGIEKNRGGREGTDRREGGRQKEYIR